MQNTSSPVPWFNFQGCHVNIDHTWASMNVYLTKIITVVTMSKLSGIRFPKGNCTRYLWLISQKTIKEIKNEMQNETVYMYSSMCDSLKRHTNDRIFRLNDNIVIIWDVLLERCNLLYIPIVSLYAVTLHNIAPNSRNFVELNKAETKNT